MILHIVPRKEWQSAVVTGDYRPESLATEGFIHCSTAAQVLDTANEFYHGRSGLVLLVIDPARLPDEVVYEDLYGKGQAFPHIYGSLSPDAVIDMVDFPPSSDGSFPLPPGFDW